jgi:hypothetical protein
MLQGPKKNFTQRRQAAKLSQRKSLRILCVSAPLRVAFGFLSHATDDFENYAKRVD